MQTRAVILSVAKNLLLFTPSLAAAQGLRGTVVSRAGTPVPGVVVLMLDDRDSVSARALTNENGEYRLSGSGAGAYRLRTMRIGFRPSTSERIQLSLGQELVQTLTLSEVPFSLDTVRVAGRGSCQTPKDSAATTFAIWEQARTALTATQLTVGNRGIEATLMTYQRWLEPNRERVTSHRSSIVSGLTRGLWTSASIDSLRRAGYIVTSVIDGSTTYWAPDLRVLLSDHFIEDHCFRLAESRDPTRIGIEFEPTRERRNVPGIRGTLWLDRKSAELRRMEFRYANATREQEYGNAGGNMEFARAASGAWIISGWNVRMPVLVQRESRVSGLSGSRATSTELRVESIKLEGGEVALVMRGRDTLWARPPMPLVGSVVDSATGVAVADADVSLRGTGLHATTDRTGRFRIADALPGEYTAEVRTKALSSFGFVQSAPLTFADTVTVHTLRLPTVAQVAETVCPVRQVGVTAQRRDGMVSGTVRLIGDTTQLERVRIVAQWNEVTGTGARWGGLETYTDARGAFRLCGLPLNIKVVIGAWADSTTRGLPPALEVTKSPGTVLPGTGTPTGISRGGVGEINRLRGPRTLTLVAPVEATLSLGTRFTSVEIVLDPQPMRGATLTGVVLSDISGQPMPDVEVAIKEQSRSVYTNEMGAFRMDDIAPGTHTVTARKVGYALLSTSLDLEPGSVVEKKMMLSRVATLDTVVTIARGDIEFEENRKLGLGQFLTRADLDKLGGSPISGTLREFRGAGIINGRGNAAWLLNSRATQGTSVSPEARSPNTWCPEPSARGGTGQFGFRCGCYAAVYFDGVLMNPPEAQIIGGRAIRPTPPFDVNSIPSASMEAIEWYVGGAQVPARYSSYNTECGVLVIHRKKNK
jgi:hypothetical protein